MSEHQSEVRSTSVVDARTADDIQDVFNQLDSPAEKEQKEERVPKEEKEVKEDKEIVEEDAEDLELVEEEEDEEALDLKEEKDDERSEELEIEVPPRKKELLKDYPDLFKKHPYLEKMLYRDRQYTELLGSFDDAKELVGRAEVFDNFEKQLLDGNTEEVLKNVKETDPKAFDKLVDNYMMNLFKVDKDAYYEVTGNVAKKLIAELVKEAKSSGKEELQEAALIVNQFMFGTSIYTPAKARVESNPQGEKNEVEAERLSYVQERFDTSRNELQTKVDNILRSTISQYIDPRESMTAYVKKNAINDAMIELRSSLDKNSTLRKNLDNLWRVAFDSKFSPDSLKRIQSIYLGTAKTVLASVIKKARAEALKDTPHAKRVEKDEEEDNSSERVSARRNITPGRSSQPNSKSEMKKGESVQEYFARE